VDLAAVFALSLLGGYFFVAWWRLTAYATRRFDGHHLYFRAAICGVIFFALALGARTYLVPLSPTLQSLDRQLIEYVGPALKDEPTGEGKKEEELHASTMKRRAEWVVIALYSLLFGPLTAWTLNRFTPRRWAQKRTVGALDRLLLRAQEERTPVSVTVNGGKVYIGLVASITDPDDDPAVIQLLPMLSGYRDVQGRLTLTTDYSELYAKLRAGKAQQLKLAANWTEQFHIAIRADSILSVNLFSTAIYAEFNPDWKQRIAVQNQRPPPQELLVRVKPPL
jgi:hypothetical protein